MFEVFCEDSTKIVELFEQVRGEVVREVQVRGNHDLGSLIVKFGLGFPVLDFDGVCVLESDDSFTFYCIPLSGDVKVLGFNPSKMIYNKFKTYLRSDSIVFIIPSSEDNDLVCGLFLEVLKENLKNLHDEIDDFNSELENSFIPHLLETY